MLGKKYTALLLAVLVAAAEANTVNLKSPLINKQLTESKWDGVGLTAIVNDYVDETIGMLVPFIIEHGLDPMPLPDIEEGFEVKPVLITYSAWLKIINGRLTGLTNISRSGDQIVNYFAKMLRVRLQIQFTDTEFVYDYLIKVMNIGPTGGIRGSLDRFQVIVDLLIDFNNDEVHLQEFSITDIGRLRVRLTGNILTDWLLNPVVSIFVRIVDNLLVTVVQNNIRTAIHQGLEILNVNIKQVIQAIEAIN